MKKNLYTGMKIKKKRREKVSGEQNIFFKSVMITWNNDKHKQKKEERKGKLTYKKTSKGSGGGNGRGRKL